MFEEWSDVSLFQGKLKQEAVKKEKQEEQDMEGKSIEQVKTGIKVEKKGKLFFISVCPWSMLYCVLGHTAHICF